MEVLLPLEYISPFRYAYQVYALNEYDDLNLSCRPQCDPVRDLDFEETLEESIIGTACVGIGFYILSYLLMLFIARKTR